MSNRAGLLPPGDSPVTVTVRLGQEHGMRRAPSGEVEALGLITGRGNLRRPGKAASAAFSTLELPFFPF